MIHLIDEKCLRVWHVASHVKRKVLPATVAEQMMAGNHARYDQSRHVWIVPLPDQVFIRNQFPYGVRQRTYRSEVIAAKT
jgi:hypothetical protein